MTTFGRLRYFHILFLCVTIQQKSIAQNFLDTGFAEDGIFPPLGISESVTQTIQLDDQSYVIASISGNASIYSTCYFRRLNQYGAVEEDFGDNGILQVDPMISSSEITMVKYDVDGVVACGRSWGDSNGSFVIKFFGNGTLDSGFGVNGYFNYPLPSSWDVLFKDIDIQSDGKIIVAGSIRFEVGLWRYFAMRLNVTGTMDSSFGVNGVYIGELDSVNRSISKITIDSNDNITFCGTSSSYYLVTVIRLNPDGDLDESFYQFSELLNFGVYEFLTNSMDEMFILGYLFGSQECGLISLNSDGTPNLEFANNSVLEGNIISGFDASFSSMCMDQYDNLILASTFNTEIDDKLDVLMIRVTNAGQVDFSFGINGVMHTDLDILNNNGSIRQIINTVDGGYLITTRSESKLCKFIADEYIVSAESDVNIHDQFNLVYTDGLVHLILSNNYLLVEAFDMHARRVLAHDVKGLSESSIDISGFASSIYIFRFLRANGAIELVKLSIP